MFCRTLTEFCVNLSWLGIKISCLVIANVDFYHFIKGGKDIIYRPLLKRWWNWYPYKIDSTDHCFPWEQEKKKGNGNFLANLWPSYTGDAIIFRLRISFHFDPESILSFADETRVKERDWVKRTDLLTDTEPEADNVLIQIKPCFFNM